MILEEFLSFKKFDIEDDITSNPTSFTVDSLTQAISDSINLLKPIRPSSQRTEIAIKSIMEKHMKQVDIGGHYDDKKNRIPDTWIYERTIESDILKLWLYRFSEQNLSYNNVYNALVPYLNTGNAFPVNLRQIEDTELIEFISKDENEEMNHELESDKLLYDEYAKKMRVLTIKFPSYNTFTAIKFKKTPSELRTALKVDFNDFTEKVNLIPNNESKELNEELINILFNTVCSIKELKRDSNFEYLIDDLDNFINITSEISKLYETLNDTNDLNKDIFYIIEQIPFIDDEVFKSVNSVVYSLDYNLKNGEKYRIPIFNNFLKLLFDKHFYIKQHNPKAKEFTDNNQNINSSAENPYPLYIDITLTDELQSIFEDAYRKGFEIANDWFNKTYTNPYKQLRDIFTKFNFENLEKHVYDVKFLYLRKSDFKDMGYYSCIYSRLLEVKNNYPVEYENIILENSKIKNNNIPFSLLDKPNKIVDQTIDISKYDPEKIFNQCISKKVFKCEKDIFDAWLVNGTGAISNDKIKWLFDSKNKRQLKFFMCEITGQKVSVKQMNMIFDVIVDTDNRPGKLDDKLLALLTLCNIKFSQKK